MPNNTPGKEENLSQIDECRTQHINVEFSNCLAGPKRYRCNHAFLFGDEYLCTHPNHREFV